MRTQSAALPAEVRSTFDNAASASRAYEEAADGAKGRGRRKPDKHGESLAGLSNSQDITRTVGLDLRVAQCGRADARARGQAKGILRKPRRA